MNLKHHLNSFENKLKVLSLVQKTQLYLIPILMALFILYNFIDLKEQRIFESKNILEKNHINTYDFLKHLQQFANNNSLTILNTQQEGTTFNLEIEGIFLNIMRCLYFLETYKSVNEITNLELSSKEEMATINIEFELAQNKYDFDKTKIPSFIQNPFASENVKEKIVLATKNTKENILQINAIVNNEALINDIWVRKGEIILDYFILEINTHTVVLQNSNKEKITLKLRKE